MSIFVVVLKVTGNGSLSWAIVQYIVFSVIGLFLLLNLAAACVEWRKGRRKNSTD
jgi:hypothetical protein